MKFINGFVSVFNSEAFGQGLAIMIVATFYFIGFNLSIHWCQSKIKE